jgi:hypothetical protein
VRDHVGRRPRGKRDQPVAGRSRLQPGAALSGRLRALQERRRGRGVGQRLHRGADVPGCLPGGAGRDR